VKEGEEKEEDVTVEDLIRYHFRLSISVSSFTRGVGGAISLSLVPKLQKSNKQTNRNVSPFNDFQLCRGVLISN
jgi:hypothetical protein